MVETSGVNPIGWQVVSRAMCVAACASMACVLACAPVDAREDFGRAGQLIQERTAVADAYDPSAADALDAKVTGLLDGGLTVTEAVQLALLNNRELQDIFAEIGVSRADLVQSQLLSNPSLALGFNFPEGGGVVDLTLGFTQQVAELWQIPMRRRVAERQLDRTITLAAQRAIELRAKVRTQCYDVLALRRSDELAGQNVELSERIVQAAQKQFEGGQVSEFDVNRTRTSLLNVRADRMAIRGALGTSEATLGDLLGLARAQRSWQLVDELPENYAGTIDSDALLRCAMDQRLDARAAELDVESAEAELALQVRRVYPDVQVGFALERNERRGAPGRKLLADTARSSIAAGQLTAPSIESRGQRSLARSQIIDAKLGPSLAVTLPIWDQNQAQIAKARFRAMQARTRYERLLDAIAVQVNQAAIQATTTADLIHLYESESLPVGESTVDGATRLYEAGEQSVLAVVDAQEQLIQRRRDLVRALRDHAAAVTELENAVGGKLPDSSLNAQSISD
ncbi:MAG: TolC family protein [Phycisphaerales bacterium]|nr:TolC family protein [Phycisphaerales bacterium]